MTKYYSKSTCGFYDKATHGDNMPQDAAPVSDEEYLAMLQVPIKRDPTLAEQIVELEAQQTPRRIRDAALGKDNGWLVALETQIKALRDQLN